MRFGLSGQLPLPGEGETQSQLVTTQSMQMNVDLRVSEIPREGQNLQAGGAEATPGGGYVGAAAAKGQGVRVLCASPLGTGPNSHAIRRNLEEREIETLNGVIVGDVGVGVSLVEDDGKMASVVAAGVEVETSRELLDSVDLEFGDIVLVHGRDLAVQPSADVLVSWVPEIQDDVTVVLAVSPAVDQVPAEIWIPILKRADIVSMNIRETAAIREIINAHSPGTGLRNIMRPSAAMVRRLGSLGCDLQISLEDEPILIRPFPSETVDTTGVGDTHVAVMCAALLQGYDLVDACVRANAASALMIQHAGTTSVPTREQVDTVVRAGSAKGVGDTSRL